MKVLRGREGSKISELSASGWELTAEHRGPLRTELTFRKPQPESALAKIWARFRALAPATQRRVAVGAVGGAIVLVLVTTLALATAGRSDEVSDPTSDEKADTAATAPAEPARTPSPDVSGRPAPDPSPPTPEVKESESPTAPAVITAENTPAFAAILKGDDCSDDYAAFSKKYEGQEIRFDGSIVTFAPHGDADTRFDFLIGPGDEGPETTVGPRFQFVDVNYYDFGLTGKNQPESIEIGALFRFTAVVGSYNEDNCLFALQPVSTVSR